MDRLNPLNDFAFQKSLGESGGVKDGWSDTQGAGEDGPDNPRSGDVAGVGTTGVIPAIIGHNFQEGICFG